MQYNKSSNLNLIWYCSLLNVFNSSSDTPFNFLTPEQENTFNKKHMKKSSSSTIQPMRWIDYPFIWFAVFVLWIIWCLTYVERSKRAEVQREIVIVENKRLVHLLDLTTDFRVKTNAKLTPISKLREKSKICIQSCLYTVTLTPIFAQISWRIFSDIHFLWYKYNLSISIYVYHSSINLYLPS